ncbi:MAG: hypothetical protein ACLU0O_10045 [Collinsella sp.]
MRALIPPPTGDDVKNFIGNITTVASAAPTTPPRSRFRQDINADGSINLEAVAGGQQGGKPKAAGQRQGTSVCQLRHHTIKVTHGLQHPARVHLAYRPTAPTSIRPSAQPRSSTDAFTAVSGTP